jgi:hypothetical protein
MLGFAKLGTEDLLITGLAGVAVSVIAYLFWINFRENRLKHKRLRNAKREGRGPWGFDE